ncbi:MAG: HlyC/CorC family transporter [Bacteroidales bacterium]|nr:HlyC/CorC family transporter [Bacteroidales bacterium]
MSNLTVIIITLGLSAFFSGMETAFLAANKLQIELDKKLGSTTSKIISVFISNPGFYITTMLTGSIFSMILYGMAMVKLIDPFLQNYMNSGTGVLILVILFSSIVLILTAEFIPKVVVRLNPNVILNAFAWPLIFFYVILYPVTIFTQWLSNKLSSDHPSQQITDNTFSKIDLYQFVSGHENRSDENSDGSEELKLFQNALEFSSVRVRDCMIPRTEIVALDKTSSIEELRKKFIETGYSKILIYDDNFDNMIGYVTSKELFKNPDVFTNLLIEVSFVPEPMPASILLQKLIQEHKSMAVVIDEFGGISGLITVEDIIEEIFGEIEDEHDLPEFIEKRIGENEYIFSGRMEIETINEKYKLNIPESEEYETLAGYLFFHYQSFPKVNEMIAIGPFQFKIIKVSKTRIELVKVKIDSSEK